MRSNIINKIWILIKILQIVNKTNSAVMAPAWANPKLNPCATQPNGWQLLYWPPDGKCYKIFQVGYPCPNGMELTPAVSKFNQQLSAECKCPPKTAQSATDEKCYQLFTQGPCEKGNYFAPDVQYHQINNSSKREWGICKQIKNCNEKNFLYWPKDEKCYEKMTQGPCSKGQLFVINENNGMSECRCDSKLHNNQYTNGLCYQHFTRGPCLQNGHLFLPDKTCGCYSFLPHFYGKMDKCYELGSVEPCQPGEIFQLNNLTKQGTCECKKNYIRYKNSPSCYRPFTQGPCDKNNILLNSTTCIQQPCQRGHLYFPLENQCYRIGTQGPCRKNRVVSFDFDVRPSIDGVSFNGRCICRTGGCNNNNNQYNQNQIACDRTKGLVRYRNECHKLYIQGPCPIGSWLVPKRRTKELQLWNNEQNNNIIGVCECLPNYTRKIRKLSDKTVIICVSPTVILADYLNSNFSVSITYQ